MTTATYLLLFAVLFTACNAFKHGYTWRKAENSYNLVTADKKNFGNQRLVYNKGFHNNSELSQFLDCRCNDRGLPDFIYEYRTAEKLEGIKLFYVQRDSVFIFEEPTKRNLRSVLKTARKMDDYERQTYARLKNGTY